MSGVIGQKFLDEVETKIKLKAFQGLNNFEISLFEDKTQPNDQNKLQNWHAFIDDENFLNCPSPYWIKNCLSRKVSKLIFRKENLYQKKI